MSLIPGDPASAQVLGPAWFPWIFISVGAFAMLSTLVTAAKALMQRPSVSDDVGIAHSSSSAPLSGTGGNHSWTIADAQASGQQGSAVQTGYRPDPDGRDRLR